MIRIQECKVVSGRDLIIVGINWRKSYSRPSGSQAQLSSRGCQEVPQSGALFWDAWLSAHSLQITTL